MNILDLSSLKHVQSEYGHPTRTRSRQAGLPRLFPEQGAGHLAAALGGLALALACTGAGAQDLNQLKGVLGGGSSSSSQAAGSGGLGGLGDIGAGALGGSGSSSLGNATGVIEYCIKNNYLSGDAASSVKDKLMGKLSGTTGQPAQKDSDYLSGAQGILKTGNGNSMDLSGGGLKAAASKQVCDTVLQHAKSFL